MRDWFQVEHGLTGTAGDVTRSATALARDADEAAEVQACFLPVEITEDVRHEDEPSVVAGGRIEFDLAGGHRLTISGSYDPDVLARLIRGLSG